MGQPSFTFIAGALCLDFTNTVGGLRGGEAQDQLREYGDLLDWSEAAAILTGEEHHELHLLAQQTLLAAETTWQQALALRETLYTLFAALAAQETPPDALLAHLNMTLTPSMQGMYLMHNEATFTWAWPPKPLHVGMMLSPIARSAAALLTSPERLLLRQCASPTCGWLFIDATKNHRRQWCSPQGCGNKARVRRYRTRQHHLA